MTIRKRRKAPPPEPIAGNGLLNRRMLLGRGIMFAGARCATKQPHAVYKPLESTMSKRGV